MEEHLTLSHLSVSYGGTNALRDVSASFPSHQITAVIGPSGCGKTTLLHAINRMAEELPNAVVTGEVRLGGRNVRELPVEQLRRKVGLVFQTPQPFPVSIYRNMSYVPRFFGIHDKGKLEEIAREKLELVGLWDELNGDLRRNATALSGGQQQRLCIARALTAEPEVLLLDEPCSALDVKSTQVIEDLLLRLKEQYTIVIVTHNLAQARRISDRTLFLYGGSVEEAGFAEKLFSHPEHPRTRDFLAGVFG